MADLKENLGKLDEKLPKIPEWLDGLEQRDDALTAAANAFLQTLAEKQAAAAELVAQAKASLAASRDTGVEWKETLASSVEAVETAVSSAIQGLESARDAVSDAVGVATDAMERLRDRLEDAGTSAEDARERAGERVEALGEGIATVEGDLADALETAVDAAEDAVEAAKDAGERLADAAEELRELIKERATQAIQELDVAVDDGEQLQGDHDSHVAEQGGLLTEGVGELGDEVATRTEGEVREPLGEARDGVVSALGELKQELADGTASAEKSTSELETAFGDVATAAEPLPAGIEAVKEGARTTGIPWA
jgi:ABC-type transporter Mla subunit MlaD